MIASQTEHNDIINNVRNRVGSNASKFKSMLRKSQNGNKHREIVLDFNPDNNSTSKNNINSLSTSNNKTNYLQKVEVQTRKVSIVNEIDEESEEEFFSDAETETSQRSYLRASKGLLLALMPPFRCLTDEVVCFKFFVNLPDSEEFYLLYTGSTQSTGRDIIFACQGRIRQLLVHGNEQVQLALIKVDEKNNKKKPLRIADDENLKDILEKHYDCELTLTLAPKRKTERRSTVSSSDVNKIPTRRASNAAATSSNFFGLEDNNNSFPTENEPPVFLDGRTVVNLNNSNNDNNNNNSNNNINNNNTLNESATRRSIRRVSSPHTYLKQKRKKSLVPQSNASQTLHFSALLGNNSNNNNNNNNNSNNNNDNNNNGKFEMDSLPEHVNTRQRVDTVNSLPSFDENSELCIANTDAYRRGSTDAINKTSVAPIPGRSSMNPRRTLTNNPTTTIAKTEAKNNLSSLSMVSLNDHKPLFGGIKRRSQHK